MAPNIKIFERINCTLLFIVILFFASCFGAGTLGGFDSRIFPVNKGKLVSAIDSLYKIHPEYSLPDKWRQFNDWSERGYDFLDGRVFYIQSAPEEMYYVTFIGDSIYQSNSGQTEISIRAVFQDKSSWKLEKDCSFFEKRRIENRFDQEIISKLEQYLNTKAYKEK